MPRCASASSGPQTSAIVSPSRPRDRQRPQQLLGLEPGAQHHDVRRGLGAVLRPHARRRDRGDRRGDEVDVVAAERRVPAVVEQHPLAERRVVRQRLRDQVGPPGQLALHVPGEHPPVPVVDRVDRTVAGAPTRGSICSGGVHPVVEVPRQPRAVPAPVERHVLHQQRRGVVDGGEVDVVGRGPLRRALEDRDVPGPLGDRGHDLHRARPGADDRHPLAGDVEVRGPARRVEQRARGTRPGPGSGGIFGRLSCPTAVITASAVSVSPAAVVTVQRWSARRPRSPPRCRTG